MTTPSLFSETTIEHLRSAIGKLAAQLDSLAGADLTSLQNSRAINAITRALKDNTRLLEQQMPAPATPSPARAPLAPAAPQRVREPAETPAPPAPEAPLTQSNAADAAPEPSQSLSPPVESFQKPVEPCGSPAVIRRLPEFPEFRKRFFAAWKTRYPGFNRSRINAALQSFLENLARSPRDPQAVLQHIMHTGTYTEPAPQAKAQPQHRAA